MTPATRAFLARRGSIEAGPGSAVEDVGLRDAPRRPGAWEGQLWVAEDFDEPLPPEIAAGFGVDEESGGGG